MRKVFVGLVCAVLFGSCAGTILPTQTPYPTNTAYPTYTAYPTLTPYATQTPYPTLLSPTAILPTETPSVYESIDEDSQCFKYLIGQGATIEDDSIVLKAEGPSFYAFAICLGHDEVTDFILDADVTYEGPGRLADDAITDVYGFQFRDNLEEGSYVFRVSHFPRPMFCISSRNYTIAQDDREASIPMINPSSPRGICWVDIPLEANFSDRNHFQILAKGKRMEFSINGYTVAVLHDNWLTNGSIMVNLSTSGATSSKIRVNGMSVTDLQ
jgi:hypothetical protein